MIDSEWVVYSNFYVLFYSSVWPLLFLMVWNAFNFPFLLILCLNTFTLWGANSCMEYFIHEHSMVIFISATFFVFPLIEKNKHWKDAQFVMR